PRSGACARTPSRATRSRAAPCPGGAGSCARIRASRSRGRRPRRGGGSIPRGSASRSPCSLLPVFVLVAIAVAIAIPVAIAVTVVVVLALVVVSGVVAHMSRLFGRARGLLGVAHRLLRGALLAVFL